MIPAAVGLFAALLAIALVVGLVAERLRFPYSVALVVTGVAVATLHPRIPPLAFGPDWLPLFLPPLVFEAAWNLELAVLRRMAPAIVVLAVGGVFASAGFVALGGVAAGLPLGAALVLGAILCATDPVAVIAVFRSLRVPADLATLVEAESIANDGVALVLAELFVPVALGAGVASLAPDIARSVAAPFGGAAIGIALAWIASRALRLAPSATFEALATIVVAYGAYLAAESLHMSGIFASAAAGISLRAFETVGATEETKASVDAFWGVAAFLANALLFLIMGLTIRLDAFVAAPLLTALAFVGTLAGRALPAYALLPPLRSFRQRAWSHVVAASGLRGGLALALAFGLPATMPARDFVVDAVAAVVFLTLVLQGVPIAAIVRRVAAEGST